MIDRRLSAIEDRIKILYCTHCFCPNFGQKRRCWEAIRGILWIELGSKYPNWAPPEVRPKERIGGASAVSDRITVV